jgi:ferredoxin-NADP reductase
MAGTALRGRLTWQVAKVSAVAAETASVRTITLDVPDWPGHQAGQHLDIRLTDELRAGDDLELRGPIGGYFVWEPADGGPLLLLAGGSGIVPLRSMLRHRERTGSTVPVRLLYSSRTLDDVIYQAEFGQPASGVEVVYTLTRHQPPGWAGYMRRVDAALLAQVAWPTAATPLAYVCGPTNFVEAVSQALVQGGYPPQRVKTERFGATGGT